ncbi:MAG: hypothetical protein HZA58_08390 [Acidimicrobiia bacterium]|nr:hypothetical protein [Acidimicrobiia bacterium]
MRTITIPAGARTLVFRRRFSSLPRTIRFDADAPGGTVERIGSRWILGRTPSTGPLQSHNEVRKGYWDTFFEIFVTPDRPVRVTIARPRLARRLLIGSLALAVVAAAAVVVKLA